jgi:hypothetical protein
MQSEAVFVIQISDDDEIALSTTGCKSKSPNYRGAAVVTDISTPTASGWKEVIRVDQQLSEFAELVDSYNGNDAGLYIAGHGYADNLGHLRGGQLGELVLELKFKTLRKVNLLACNIANNIGAEIGQTFLLDFAKVLHTKGMRPLIACYVGWNSTAYKPPQFALPQAVREDIQRNLKMGEKLQNVLTATKKGIVSKGGTLVKADKSTVPLKYVENKADYKKIVQLNENGTTLRMATLEEYTDKGK